MLDFHSRAPCGLANRTAEIRPRTLAFLPAFPLASIGRARSKGGWRRSCDSSRTAGATVSSMNCANVSHPRARWISRRRLSRCSRLPKSSNCCPGWPSAGLWFPMAMLKPIQSDPVGRKPGRMRPARRMVYRPLEQPARVAGAETRLTGPPQGPGGPLRTGADLLPGPVPSVQGLGRRTG